MLLVKPAKLLLFSTGADSGAPTYFLTTLILGVRPTRPGYSEYVLAPNPAGLEWAKGTVPTVHGAIIVDWKWIKETQADPVSQIEARFILHLQNPSSETAQVILPKHNGKEPASVTLDGKPVSKPIAVKSEGSYTVEVRY